MGEDGAQVRVDPGGSEVAERPHLGGRAEQQAGEGDRVDAEVEQGAAGQGRLLETPGRAGDREPEARLDGPQLADLAGLHPAGDLDDGRQEPRPHGLHQEAPVASGRRHHLPRLTCVHRERLLAHHVTACPEGGHGHGPVLAVGRGDVDDVDVVVGEQRLVAAVGAGDAVALGEGGGPLVRPGPDGHHLGVVEGGEGLGHRPGDRAGPGDPPAQDVGHADAPVPAWDSHVAYMAA